MKSGEDHKVIKGGLGMASTGIAPIFISYSHKDKVWVQNLKTMLAPHIQNKTIVVWDDSDIEPGMEWAKEIKNALGRANAAVLLVSPNYLASDYIVKNELPPLLDACQERGLKVLWIYISSCRYEVTALAKYQALHDVSRPLDQLARPKRNEALKDICDKLKQVVTEPQSAGTA